MKYRKKPVIIEAFQMHYRPGANWDDTVKYEWPIWFREAVFKEIGTEGSVYLQLNGLWVVWTLEGVMEINPGDYVIKGIKNEIYPCREDIFNLTYEVV